MSGQRNDDAQGHAFISYAREDRRRVDRLQGILESAGIRVWRDTANIWPGQDWKIEIRKAILTGSLAFIACFSENTELKDSSYQNEELILAVEQMRRRPPGVAWLIPVRFAECNVPAFDLGAGRTLDSLQRIDLFDSSWEGAVPRLVGAVVRITGTKSQTVTDRTIQEQLDSRRDRADPFETPDLSEQNKAQKLGSLLEHLLATPLVPSAELTSPATWTESNALRENERKIRDVLKILDDAEQTPDLLEVDISDVLARGGVEIDTHKGEIVTLATYLYLIARECRDTVRNIAKYLRAAGWTQTSADPFQQAFENLVDVWAVYKSVFRDLQDARWRNESSYAQVQIGTARRRYIKALEMYDIQVLVALQYCNDDTMRPV